MFVRKVGHDLEVCRNHKGTNQFAFSFIWEVAAPEISLSGSNK